MSIDPIKEYGDPFANHPPLLKFGYVTPGEFNELSDAFEVDRNGDLLDPMGLAVTAKALCEDNIPLFHALFLDKDPMPHMPDIFGQLKNMGNRVLFEASRSHGKSDLGVIADGMHNPYYGMDPESDIELKTTLILQESTTMAEQTIQSMQIEMRRGGPNGLLKAAFGDLQSKAIKWTGDTIWLEGDKASKDPTLTCAGAGAAITGGHPMRVLGDDVVSTKNSETPHQRNRMWKWWLTTPEGMFDPGTMVRLTYTPKFADDNHGRLKATKKWESMSRPAFNRMVTADDYEEIFSDTGVRKWVRITEAGMDLEALWPCPFGTGRCIGPQCADGKIPGIPMHRSAEYLIHDKLLGEGPGSGSRAFAQEFMLSIVPEEDIVVQPQMLRFWSNDPTKWGATTEHNHHPIVPLPDKKDIVLIAQAWDHAISDRAKADYTAVATAYRDTQNNVYFKVRAGKWDFPTVKRMMASHYETEPMGRPAAVVTEDIGMQKAFGQEVLAGANSIIPIVPLSELGYRRGAGKLDSMLETGYLTGLSNGQVYFQLEDRDTIEEHLAFTGGKGQSLHDDRVDACRMAWAFIRARVGGKARVFKPNVNRSAFGRR